MNIVLNIIWVVFGGLMIAIEYAVASIGMMVTIIGIPFGLQTLKLAAVALWPSALPPEAADGHRDASPA